MSTTYASASALSLTNLNSGVASGGYSGTVLFDNTSNNYDDLIVAGIIDTGGTVVADELVLIYVVPIIPHSTSGQFADGVLNAGYTGTDEQLGDGTEIKSENLIDAKAIRIDNSINQPHEFVFSIRQVLGYVPPKVGFIVYNATSNTLGTDNEIEVTGVTIS